MRTVLDILLFPVGVFMEALMGLLYPVKSARMRARRKLAAASLAGSVATLGSAIVLASLTPESPAKLLLAGIGLILMFAFLILGKLCGDEGEKRR